LQQVKILIVDDQKLFAESLAGILTGLGEGRLEEVRIAGNGEEALQLVPRYRPDLVLLDIFMPGMGGLETLRLLHDAHPAVKIIMLTTFGYDTYVKEAVLGGASGYLLKDTTPQEVWSAIDTVLNGQTVLSPAVVESLSGKPRAAAGQKSLVPPWFPLLNEKERKILLLISKGLSNEEIAEKLNLGKNTIRNYVSALYDKIEVKDRFGAIRVGIEAQVHTLVME
jgi:DNA-binding NarL/FixJ family response regulator